MRSRKEGTEPVVRALTRGMVTVGGVACAVKGIAAPERMRLEWSQFHLHTIPVGVYVYIDIPLGEEHAAVVAIDKVTPQRVNHHEDDLVEGATSTSAVSCSFLCCCLLDTRQTRQKWLVRKEATSED